MTKFRPMLAEKADVSKIEFPAIAQPKFDGIRCMIRDGKAVSRTLKDIPSLHVQHVFSILIANGDLEGLDGEIVTYDENGMPESLHEVQSKVMSAEGIFDFTFHVFDDFSNMELPYGARWERLSARCEKIGSPYVVAVENEVVGNVEELIAYDDGLVEDGWEGTIVRKPSSPYKMGRSTLTQGWLLKIKRFSDDEAEIIGFVEKFKNENELTKDERGYAKRSSAKAGKVATGTLGALILKWGDVEFEIGTGFTEEQRRQFWARQNAMLGETVNFRYKGTGPNGKPLIPSFQGVRYDLA